MRTCTMCGQTKPLDQFYREPRASDGRQARCITCFTAVMKSVRPKYAAQKLQAQKRWRADHPERQAAHKAVARALASGKLRRPDACTKCGRTCRPQAHHEDYARRLDVIWLCSQCHVRHHVETVAL